MPPQEMTKPSTTQTQTPFANPDRISLDSQTPVVRRKIRKICSLGAGYVVNTYNPQAIALFNELT